MHDSGAIGEPEAIGGVPEAASPVEAGAAENAALISASEGVYELSVADNPLVCCEILSSVSQHRRSLQSLREVEPEIETIVHPLCIVVSQDCDLEQDFRARQGNRTPSLPNVMLCQAFVADVLKGNVPRGSDIWKRIAQNKDERYQFLRAVTKGQDSAGEGLSELGVDFRLYFSIPTDELYEQISLEARRRCCLASPYKEHFMHRFANFMARVGLPLDHDA